MRWCVSVPEARDGGKENLPRVTTCHGFMVVISLILPTALAGRQECLGLLRGADVQRDGITHPV